MNRIVTTLALIAAGTAPALFAEDAIKASIGGQIQVRGEYANAYQENVGGYAPSEAAAGKSDMFNFHLRRARLGARFESASKQWSGSFVLRADDADKTGAGTNRNPALHQVFVTRTFQNPEGTVRQSIQAGLDYAFFNRADLGPSGAGLMLNQRATHSMSAQRGTGVGYRLSSNMVKWGVDVQNNAGDSAGGSQTEREGLWFSSRIELSPPESTNWNLPKYQETWGGAEGQGVLLGLEAGWNHRDVTSGTAGPNLGSIGRENLSTRTGDQITSTGVLGGELLVRYNQLVVLGEVRWQKAFNTFKTSQTAANTNFQGQSARWDTTGVIYILQAGYAIPSDFLSEGSSLQAEARYTYRDATRENRSENGAFGGADYGASGHQYELGMTYFDYIDMAKDAKGNKTSIAYTNWHAEAGTSKAHIFRIQHQVSF